MENPFNYLQFATGDQFYDRKEIRKDLLSRFLSGQSNVVLYGPRRYGKSSLVAELVGDLEKAGVPWQTAINACTLNPARLIGAWRTKGSLQTGKDADLVVLGDDYSVKATFCRGVRLYRS